MIRKKDIIEFEIEKVEFPNKGRARYEDNEIRFKGGIEGQVVQARVSRKKQKYIEVKDLKLIKKSTIETEEACPHFGICGGCAYQTLSYENELKLKEKQVKDLFTREGLDIEFSKTEPSPVIEGYRNKMEFGFGDEMKDGPLALGMHRRGRFYEVVNVPHCNIVDKDSTKILVEVLNHFQKKNKKYYRKGNHVGFLRHLVIRKALSTGQIMVNLVTSSQDELDKDDFINLLKEIPLMGQITGILHSTNDSLGDTVNADKLEVLWGEDYIIEELLGLKFKISPFSFFQTNTFGADKLYNIAREFAGDIEDKVVFDLYSGTGTIAQIMAPLAKKVIGVEIVEEAVEKAKENMKINELDNIEFIAGDVLKVIDELEDKPDLIMIDPPREGINPNAINKIIDFNPETFVYISCNPVTLARDLKIFTERGYKIEKAKLMDMFPRTPHVECIVGIQKTCPNSINI